MSGRGLPRWIELGLVVPGLVAAAPLMGALALLVRISSPGPVLFRQTRVGRGGEPFTLLKFRTMRADPGGTAVTAAGDPRVTAIGRLLRAAKLDELPQLVNVLRGEMALVGPRPEVPEFVDLGDPRWQRVLAVRPGVTSPVAVEYADEETRLAELGGDTATAYREVVLPAKLDGLVAWLDRRTALGDLGVLLGTAAAVARRWPIGRWSRTRRG